MNNKNRQLIVSLLGIVSLFLITIGVTYAVFSYTKEGTTDNVVTSGTLKFLYTENSAGGTGINISEAEPISDAQGKSLVGDSNVFDFKVEGTNTGSEVIPYEVTLRKKDTSTMSEDNIKVYLTDETESTDIVEPTLYSKLTQTNIDVGSNIEKTLYKGEVAGNTNNYLKTFRLRMWIDENSNQNDINGKSFTGMVNVYSNAKVISEEDKVTIFGKQYDVIKEKPTLNTTSLNSTDPNGLYKSTDTNTGDSTYYFRGVVENNYVSFAGQTWRIIRVNEDKTVRMIMQTAINDDGRYQLNSNNKDYSYMYYSNSEAKPILESWYNDNIGSKKEYSKYVVTGNYFCEQAKIKYEESNTAGNATMTVYSNYTPDFRCSTDENGKGLVNASIGLISYDEVAYAGGYYDEHNPTYYLFNNNTFWTMSPGGYDTACARIWYVYGSGSISNAFVSNYHTIRPVINLKAHIIASSGDGNKDNPFVIGE